ncbi:hypothetical protein AAG906_014271 [Vitis piasezkii]
MESRAICGKWNPVQCRNGRDRGVNAENYGIRAVWEKWRSCSGTSRLCRNGRMGVGSKLWNQALQSECVVVWEASRRLQKWRIGVDSEKLWNRAILGKRESSNLGKASVGVIGKSGMRAVWEKRHGCGEMVRSVVDVGKIIESGVIGKVESDAVGKRQAV